MLVAVLLCGCEQDMADQRRFEPLESTTFFPDGLASRPLVAGTVARGQLRLDTALYQGRVNGQPVQEFPLKLDEPLLRRGQERYMIYCSPCHDSAGYGQGMVVQRGFPAPPKLHIDRLRNASVGHYFSVITDGFGRMPSYADQIGAEDRWAIIAYVHALQLSQFARADDLPEPIRRQLPSAP